MPFKRNKLLGFPSKIAAIKALLGYYLLGSKNDFGWKVTMYFPGPDNLKKIFHFPGPDNLKNGDNSILTIT